MLKIEEQSVKNLFPTDRNNPTDLKRFFSLIFYLKCYLVYWLTNEKVIIMSNLFNNKYQDDILGTNSTFDRVIVSGSIIPIAYQEGLNTYLSANNILLKDFLSYAKNLAEIIKENAKSIAKKEGVQYQYVNNSQLDKEAYIKSIINDRGDHPGLVVILSGLEVDNSFDISKNKKERKLELVARRRKCLHIYFYFIDEKLGLCHFRIQPFFPFKVQIYFNGREKLARELDEANIAYQKDDNCFTWISDLITAQEIAADYYIPQLHALFDQLAEEYVPILKQLRQKWNLSYHWSIKQSEYAKDIMFKSQHILDILYKQLLQYSVLSISPEDIMSFLGKKLAGPQAGRIETSCKKTYVGHRIKHKAGAISIKMYNKCGNVLRVEITFNNISELKIYREVHQRDGQTVTKLATLKKSIYSLEHVARFGKAAIDRYLDFIANMEDTSHGVKELRQLTERKTENNKNYKGFNPLNSEDSIIFQQLLNGSFIANGFTNKNMRVILSQLFKDQNWNTSKVSRLLKRLIVFGLVKRVHKTYKYFLTQKGRLLLTLCVKLRNMTVIPAVDSLIKSLLPMTV